MEQPVIPPGAIASLKRFVSLMPVETQVILKHRWELEGAYFLTREQLADRLKLTIGDIRRIEMAARDDLKSLFNVDGTSTWLG